MKVRHGIPNHIGRLFVSTLSIRMRIIAPALATILIAAMGDPTFAGDRNDLGSRIRDGFAYRLEVLGLGTGIDLVDSELNPNNVILPR